MGRSIQEMFNIFKRIVQEDTFFYSSLFVLIAVISFGLGRWSVAYSTPESVEKTEKSIQITQPASVPVAIEAQNASTTLSGIAPKVEEQPLFVGSRSGSKYHLLWCPGAKQIKEENKVFFASKEEALKAGYTPAANCKGI